MQDGLLQQPHCCTAAGSHLGRCLYRKRQVHQSFVRLYFSLSSSNTTDCTYSLKCAKKFQGEKCHDYSNIHIDQDRDCTTDSYPTNPEYQSANPSSQHTANSKCTCNNVLTSSSTTIATTTTTTTTIILSSSATVVEPSCSSTTGPVPENTLTTVHTVYISALLVLVVVLVLLVLVGVKCLMMRRAKSGRVPLTTNDYYELESATSQKAECLKKSNYGCDQPSTHPLLPQPPTSDNVYNATYEPTSLGSHEYEVVDELRKIYRGKTTGEVHVAVEGVESEKDKKDKKEEAEKEDNEDNGTTAKP